MKKGLVFCLGTLTGIVLTIIVLFAIGVYIGKKDDIKKDSDFTLSEQPIDFTISDKFEVFQVLEDGALAHSQDKKYTGTSIFADPVVYILSNGQNLFYDRQIIEVPEGKNAIQIGTYRYDTKIGQKVVPVIKVE